MLGPKECRIVAARVARRLAQEAEATGLSVAHDLPDAGVEAASVLVFSRRRGRRGVRG
jgi:translation initiation factor RLI1